MAGHGRIQRALERAKKLRDESTTDSAGNNQADFAAERNAAAQAMPAFQNIPYDLETCTENRILVPEATAHARSPGTAAYRVLRTRLLQRARTNLWTTIGITSPSQGDGKSVTALNLAMSIAREANNSVFLIDLDMRSPKICQYLGVEPPMPISEYFASKDSKPEDILFSTGIENLTLAGSQIGTDKASELLAGNRVDALFEYITKNAFRPLIIADLPPLLSTDDAIIIAAKVDATLLVLAEGRTRRDSAAKALELLTEFNLAAIVLNTSEAVESEYYGS